MVSESYVYIPIPAVTTVIFDHHCFMLFISGIFEDEFIEERRQGLEAFVNR